MQPKKQSSVATESLAGSLTVFFPFFFPWFFFVLMEVLRNGVIPKKMLSPFLSLGSLIPLPLQAAAMTSVVNQET